MIACGVLIASAGCASVQPARIVEPGASFTLAPEESADVRGANARITFKQVREDSRCPTDVMCVWAGDAKIEITIARQGTADESRVLSITPPNNEVLVGNLRIRFVSLAPVPRQSDNPPRRYRADFVVEQS